MLYLPGISVFGQAVLSCCQNIFLGFLFGAGVQAILYSSQPQYGSMADKQSLHKHKFIKIVLELFCIQR